MQFTEILRTRKMTRAFTTEPVDLTVIDSLLELSLRAPSAGKTQGTHFVVLHGDEVAKFWDDTLPQEKRESFRWKQLLDAPIVMIACVDPQSYVDRYSEPDKQATGLGAGIDAWPTPYWTVDGSFAVMTVLLAAHDAQLGALFFALFHGQDALRQRLGIPERIQVLGALAIGHPLAAQEPSRSAKRPRKNLTEVVHRQAW